MPRGAYALTIEPHASRPGQQGREFVDTMIDVKDHDLDLSLTVGPGASLTGRVVAEPSVPIAAAVNGDWSFRMTGLYGSQT